MPFILIIIGVITALGLGGFMWTQHEKNETITTPPEIVSTVTETPTPVPNEPTPTPTATPTSATPDSVTPTNPPATTVAPRSTFRNGTYSVEVSYKAPDREDHPVHVTLTLENDVVTASDITFGPEVKGATADFQKKFSAAYKTQVVGKSLASVKLSRVGGASLTTGAWNAAQAQIVAQAQS